MASRYSGRRVSTIAAEKKRRKTMHSKVSGAHRSPVRQKEVPMTSRERQRLIQLVICGSVFVLLVAVKLLLPGRMSVLNATLSDALQQNMDLQAVFSAVGRTFSGEEDWTGAAEEVYRAVFEPEAGEALETAAHSSGIELKESMPGEAALNRLHTYSSQEEEAPAENSTPEQQVSTLAYILYSDQNLPENVSLEQAILGFDYCSPICGTLTSPFGYREHPVEGEERFHYGVDLAANTGTEIACFADGTVKAVGESSSYGKYCIVDHAGGYSTLYAHCSRIVTSSGATVSKGEKIAEVGETGIATGPHLHFELHKDGVYLNPIYYVSTV